MSSQTPTQDVIEEKILSIVYGAELNERYRIVRGGPRRIKPTLDDVTGALRNADIKVIGLHGKNDIEIQNIIEIASRRARRDNLFDQVVVADLTNNSNLVMIQEQVARALNLRLSDGIMYRLLCYQRGGAS
ncbi:hypothetical protein L6164_017383 [Bauhinia variegata]|uniref:Uncharacterized protein n=1 Tax=Bauhinia variegata TaxID=167791 RepID=A0ACB9N8X1_BAUVA|nr:hypothetical protein L6164_017383 [Bauhinia variegata]